MLAAVAAAGDEVGHAGRRSVTYERRGTRQIADAVFVTTRDYSALSPSRKSVDSVDTLAFMRFFLLTMTSTCSMAKRHRIH